MLRVIDTVVLCGIDAFFVRLSGGAKHTPVLSSDRVTAWRTH